MEAGLYTSEILGRYVTLFLNPVDSLQTYISLLTLNYVKCDKIFDVLHPPKGEHNVQSEMFNVFFMKSYLWT